MPYPLARPQTRCTSMYPGYEQLENTESGNGIRESFRLHGMCVGAVDVIVPSRLAICN